MPLRLISILGFVMTVLATAGLVWVIIASLFDSEFERGWASLMVVQLFVAAFIFFFLGILGEYIGKIYDEARARPNYIVAEMIGDGER